MSTASATTPRSSSPSGTGRRELAVGVLAGLLVGALAVLEPILAVGLVVGLASLLVVVQKPDALIWLVVFVIYANLNVIAAQFHGVPRAAAATVPLFLLLPILRDAVRRRRGWILDSSLLWWLAFAAVGLVGAGFSRDFGVSSGAVFGLLAEGVLIYVLVTNAIRSHGTLRIALWGLLVAGLLGGLVPAFQYITGTYHQNYGGLAQMNDLAFRGEGSATYYQLSGPIGEKNRYAQNMLLVLPIGLACVWGEDRRWLKRFAMIATGFIVLGLALASSRGAAVALVILALFMVGLRWVSARRIVQFGLVGALLVLGTPQYRERLSTLGSVPAILSDSASAGQEPDGAVKGRATEMLAAILVFLDHPLVGVGPDMFSRYSQEYGNQLGIRHLDRGREAHSLYLDIVAEHGALGLICFLGAVGSVILALRRARRHSLGVDPGLHRDVTGCLLAVIAYLVSGVFLHLSYVRFLFLILGVASAAGRLRPETPR